MVLSSRLIRTVSAEVSIGTPHNSLVQFHLHTKRFHPGPRHVGALEGRRVGECRKRDVPIEETLLCCNDEDTVRQSEGLVQQVEQQHCH